MEDLNGKCFNVVLAIETGRGLPFLECLIKIVANFNGRVLESDLVKQNSTLEFNTELIWEIEKKELQKIRSINSLLRVELQTYDGDQRKDTIGYILLSTRTADIMPYDSETTFKWHKLLGVAVEYKQYCPELYISFSVRDLEIAASEIPHFRNIIAKDVMEEEEEVPLVNIKSIPLYYLPNGYIRIGGSECCQKYILSITVQVAHNLDLLLPEVSLNTGNCIKYFICFNMFGITITSKPFYRDMHVNVPMNEKIVVRIISEFETVQRYLTKFCKIIVSFYSETSQLGVTELNAQELLENMSETKFKKLNFSVFCKQNCYFKFPSSYEIVPARSNDRRPFIKVSLCFQEIETKKKLSEALNCESLENIASSNKYSTHDSRQSKTNTSGGDSSESYEEVLPEFKPLLNEDFAVDSNVIDSQFFISDQGPLKVSNDHIICTYRDQTKLNQISNVLFDKVETTMHPSIQNVTENLSDTYVSAKTTPKAAPMLSCIPKTENMQDKNCNLFYEQYCLDVIVETILLKTVINSKEINIKFKHPKAPTENTVTISIDGRVGEDILLEKTRCKLFFISTKDNIRKMVNAWPPKLVLANNYNQNLTEELDVYTAMLLNKEKFECSYVTECKSIKTYESLAKLNIAMYLQEYGLCAIPEQNNFTLFPPILDEYIIIQELQELQTWKDHQKALYSADLKILQKQQLLLMEQNWIREKSKIEEKLNRNVHKCESLFAELQMNVNNLQNKKPLEHNVEETEKLLNVTLKDLIDSNLQKYTNYNFFQLIIIISKYERENCKLIKLINDQKSEVDHIKKTALTKEQTTSLIQQLRGLEEKFEDALNAKKYFKDQWKKAVREIHDLKAEDQKQIQQQIQSQKVELSQLSLENFTNQREAIESFKYSPTSYSISKQSIFGAFKWDTSESFEYTNQS